MHTTSFAPLTRPHDDNLLNKESLQSEKPTAPADNTYEAQDFGLLQALRDSASTAQRLTMHLADSHGNIAVTTKGEVTYWRANESLWGLTKFMSLVLNTSKPGFTNRRADDHGGLAKFAGLLGSFYDSFAADVEYSPEIALFFDSYRRHPIALVSRFLVDQEREVFNAFIAFLRQEAMPGRCDTRRKLKNWRRNYQKNAKRLKTLTAALFEQYARLLVIRIDLLYRIQRLSAEEAITTWSKIDQQLSTQAMEHFHERPVTSAQPQRKHVDAHQAQADISRLLKSFHHFPVGLGVPNPFEHLVGYAWRQEWSRFGGYHYHLVLFFDGSKRQKHEHIAQSVCEQWSRVTEGRGYGHNCNRSRRYYRRWALGKVEHHDLVKRALLDEVLSYLVKPEQIVRAKPTAKCRTFQTSVLPRGVSKAGRPRTRRATPVLQPPEGRFPSELPVVGMY